MRGVFDEQDVEPSRQRRDTELTLGSGTLLAIFFGLVLLCGLCFGMGYAVGHRGAPPSAITPPQPAPDQEPLQASGSIPKPSAIAQTPVTPAADATTPDQAAAQPGAATANPAQSPAGAVQPSLAPAPGASSAQPQVHPALAPGVPETPQSPAQAVRPALSSPELMVQIAAVSNPEDADVLVNALRKRGYPVTARRDPADNYIHVRIGPFATRALADQWRQKLLNDGYNAIIQP